MTTREAHETSNPNPTPAPEHTLSDIGQQRLAALQAAEQPAPSTDPTKVVDSEGGTANLTDGTFTPPARPDPQPQAQPDAPVDDIPLPLVPDALRADAEDYRQSVANIASDFPQLKGEASVLFDYIASQAAAAFARDAKDSVLSQGETAGATLWNEQSCRSVIRQKYGDLADAVLRSAAEQFRSLPAPVKEWLDRDLGDGSRLGNHPSVIEGLALRQYAQLTPARAQAELETLRSSKTYGQGGPLEKAKLHLLGLVAARGTQPPAPAAQRQPERRAFGTRGGDPAFPTGGTEAAAKLRAELNALSRGLMDPKHEFASNPKKRRAAIQRRQDINAQLGGGK
jgi:hypothetical protein